MNPRGSLQRPGAVWISCLKLVRQLAQHRVIVRSFVVADALPIKSLRSCFAVRITIEHFGIPVFRAGPVLIHEGNTRESQFQLRAKFMYRKITLEPVSFYSIVIEYEYRGSPYCVETVEIGGTFFDVCCKGNKVFVDE